MKTLMLRDGDLVPTHRDYAQVTGVAKVAQDLRCALLEPLGNDRFHPGWGSTLDTFVSLVADADTQAEVQGEVNRVISNYAAIQRDKIEADINGGGSTRFTTDEVLSRVHGVSTSISTETIRVNIGLQTLSGDIVVVDEAVS